MPSVSSKQRALHANQPLPELKRAALPGGGKDQLDLNDAGHRGIHRTEVAGDADGALELEQEHALGHIAGGDGLVVGRPREDAFEKHARQPGHLRLEREALRLRCHAGSGHEECQECKRRLARDCVA